MPSTIVTGDNTANLLKMLFYRKHFGGRSREPHDQDKDEDMYHLPIPILAYVSCLYCSANYNTSSFGIR